MECDRFRKELMGALIALAKTCGNNPKTANTDRIILEGLVAANAQCFGEEILKKKLQMARAEKHAIAPNCSICAHPCGNTSEYDLNLLSVEEEPCRSLKEQMLDKIKDTATIFYQAMMLGINVSEHTEIFYKVLEVVTYEMEAEMLQTILTEIAEKKQLMSNLKSKNGGKL